MNINRKYKIFRIFIILVLISYTIIYIMVNLGYYEYASRKKVVLTEEQIKIFEQDIKEGKSIDLNKYIDYDKKELYNSKGTVLKVSEFISNTTIKVVNIIFKYLNNSIK